MIAEDQAVTEVFHRFLVNIVPNLKISIDHGYDNDFAPLMTKLQTLLMSFEVIQVSL